MAIHVTLLFIYLSNIISLFFLLKIDFSLNETTGHEDTVAIEDDKQIRNGGSSTMFPRISNQ